MKPVGDWCCKACAEQLGVEWLGYSHHGSGFCGVGKHQVKAEIRYVRLA